MGNANTGRREPPHEVYTVSRLNLEVRGLIEGALPPLWIEGEISNLARPRSGHIYFSLKDEHCQVRCAMFRSANRRLEFSPENGAQVLAHVRPGLYPERGEFQLLVEYMEEAGAGALWRAFDLLKARLQAEGLFDAAARKPLPTLPRGIAVLTSATGAALRDIVAVTRRRCPQVPLLLIPIPVQGAAAAPAIVAALAAAATRTDCDVVLLARGGGSIEDLWAFNEETVARAVHACPLPVVTGIGHETDFTIADFVADCRGATPSAAAELLTPDAAAWADRRRQLDTRLGLAVREHWRRAGERLRLTGRRLQHPERRIWELAQRVDGILARLTTLAGAGVDRRAATLARLTARTQRHDPRARIGALGARRQVLSERLARAIEARTSTAVARIGALARALEALGPGPTLERGYAIVVRQDDGALVRDAGSLSPGAAVRARLARGALACTVDAVEEP